MSINAHSTEHFVHRQEYYTVMNKRDSSMEGPQGKCLETAKHKRAWGSE